MALSVQIALTAGFLSAVADRFGLWGPAGTPGMTRSVFASFLTYTGTLVWFMPASLASAAGRVATAAEVILAVGLLVGSQRRWARANGLLLTNFTQRMAFARGPEPALSYSVGSAAAAALLRASRPPTSAERKKPSNDHRA